MLQEHADQGWSFDELAPGEQTDALRLLAAFIAHGDDKPENQRLVCPFDAIGAYNRCTMPRLLIADLGSTFGRGANGLGLIDGKSRPTFAAWSTLPVWEDRATCRVHWATRNAHGNPVISEGGRRFAAARLAALTSRQIRDLFTVARVERLGAASIDEWARAFERRRAEIVETRCP
jgi:hypothetical protein